MKTDFRCILIAPILLSCLTEAEYTQPEDGNRQPLSEGPTSTPPPLGNVEPTTPVGNEPQPPSDGNTPLAGSDTPNTPSAADQERRNPLQPADPAAGGVEDVQNPQAPPESQDPPSHGNIEEAETGCTLLFKSKSYFASRMKNAFSLESTTTPDYADKKILIEIVRHRPEEGSIVLYNFSCTPPLNLELPSDIGPVYAVYFIDQNGDGPSKEDILGRSPLIEPEEQKTISLTISMKEGNDISPLTFPFMPLSKTTTYERPPYEANPTTELPPPLAEPEANLPPPVAEPEAGLPEPLAEPEGNLPPPVPRAP